MAQPRLIKYLENGVYKYASVKDIGDLEKLRTTAKSDLVAAINELITTGGAVPQEIKDRISDVENRVSTQETNLSTVETTVNQVKTEYELSKEDIALLQTIQSEVKTKAEDAVKRASELESKTDQIKTDLINKVDTETYTTQYDQVKSDLLAKVDSQQYKSEYESIVLSLQSKAEAADVDSLQGKFSTVEKSVTDLEGEVATKITSTEFDDAVGVNKWISSRYLLSGTDLSQTPPSFPLIRGLQAVEVTEVEDGSTLPVVEVNDQVTHFFTNVKLKTPKDVLLNVIFDDSLAVYVNGGMVFQSKYDEQSVDPVSMSLRAGWNTIEILHGQKDGTPVLNLGALISQQVDKMTTVIGVGDKNETRFTQAETAIIQNEKSISLKANQTDVTEIGNRVTENEATLVVLTNKIESKVEQKDFDAYSKRLTDAESTIVQQASEISQRVKQTDFDSLNDIVSSQETKITQLSNDITFKVDVDTYNGLEGRVSSAETQINLNKDAINLKASQQDLDSVSGRLTTAEGQITVANNEIASKVSKKDYDNDIGALQGRMSSAETSIIQTQDSITSKAEKTDVYTRSETEDMLGDKADKSDLTQLVERVSHAESEIDQQTDEIALRVTKSEFDSMSIGGRNILKNSKFSNDLVNWVEYGSGNNGVREIVEITDLAGFSRGVRLKADNVSDIFGYVQNNIPVINGQKYTLSAWYKFIGTTGKIKIQEGSVDSGLHGKTVDYVDNEWHRIAFTSTPVGNTFYIGITGIDSSEVIITGCKMELGTKETDWSPSPEEIDENIASSVSQAKAEIKLTTDGITQSVEDLSKTVGDQGTTIESHTSSIDSLKDRIELTVTKDEIVDSVKKVRYIRVWSNGNSVNTGNHIVELEAFNSSEVNVASGLSSITSSYADLVNPAKMTDGIKDSNSYLSFGNGKQWVQLDLGSVYEDIEYLNVWLYYKDERTYREADIEISTDGVGWTKLHRGDIKTTNKGFIVVVNNGLSIQRINSAEASIAIHDNQIKEKVTIVEVDNAIGKIKVGGENLFLNSALDDYDEETLTINDFSSIDSNFTLDTETKFNGKNTLLFKYLSGMYPLASSNYIDVTNSIGEEVVLSVWVYIPNGVTLSGNPLISISSYSDDSVSTQGDANPSFAEVYINKQGNGKWTRYYCKGVIPATNEYGNVLKIKANLRFMGTNSPTSADTFWYALPKLEYGNVMTDWSPATDDLISPLTDLTVRMKNAEQVINEDNIVSTVTSSVTFANLLDSKADSSLLSDYATNDALNSSIDDVNSSIGDKVKEQIDNLDLETFSQFSELKQSTTDISANFVSASGVNLIKNSVGFAGFDFWTKNGNLEIRQNEGLDVLGYGSGFFAESGKSGYIEQVIPVNPERKYTLSFFVDKPITSTTSAWAGADIWEDGVKTIFIGANNDATTIGYQQYSYTFQPKGSEITLRLTVGSNAVATITGAMLNIGEAPLQWTMAQGEIYNTNVRFDMKGIKVAKIEDDKESRFTVMTPDKFAGYYDVNGDGVIDSSDGSPDEVFKMDDDSFVMKKANIKEEATLDTIKVVKINTSTNKGIAFIPADI
ncbi:discoidin domain-containing protein [Bacillus spizizenii]|nr:discoidin domain-containing protein [Bacillus spizizenii]MCY9124890.1 discoidin domain-containing protein [Bacillus spizizenii]